MFAYVGSSPGLGKALELEGAEAFRAAAERLKARMAEWLPMSSNGQTVAIAAALAVWGRARDGDLAARVVQQTSTTIKKVR
ncbi:MAG: hypothetical protein HY002_02745 [Candidatus Rokubacteria bacterium]|nr:hypothetical protein [Candidatus Rokubacteria bacterium]